MLKFKQLNNAEKIALNQKFRNLEKEHDKEFLDECKIPDLFLPETRPIQLIKIDKFKNDKDLADFEVKFENEAKPSEQKFINHLGEKHEKNYQELLECIQKGDINKLNNLFRKTNCISKYFNCFKPQIESSEFSNSINIQDEDLMTPLHWAVVYNQPKIVQYFLNEGCIPNIPNINGHTPFHKAILNGHLNIVKIFIYSNKIDINEKNLKTNMSPLYMATKYNLFNIVELLIQAKCNLDETNDFGDSTALHLASKSGYLKIVESLILAGANLNKKAPINGNTAVIKCSISNYARVLILLIQNGADINIQNNKGNTALHEAIDHGNLEIIKILLFNHARTDLKNINQKTVFDLIENPRHDDIPYRISNSSEILKFLTLANRLNNKGDFNAHLKSSE